MNTYINNSLQPSTILLELSKCTISSFLQTNFPPEFVNYDLNKIGILHHF